MSNQIMLSLEDFYHNHFSSKEDGTLFLDVRTEQEFLEGTIPGSVNISHELVGDHLEELRGHQKIFIFCKRGGRAQTALQVLAQANLSADLYCVFDAGMDRWQELGYPVSND
jgi:rhodanese-related sulfurtransferase